MVSLQVYGIPNCGTCKKARQWLDTHKIDYQFIDTKVQPPDRHCITNWVETLGNKSLRNTSGQSYRALGSTKDNWTDTEWIDAFCDDAMLLKRPIFVKDHIAIASGFRNESALKELLGS